MKVFLKVISVVLILGMLGNLANGKFSPVVFILALVTVYFGWIKNNESTDKYITPTPPTPPTPLVNTSEINTFSNENTEGNSQRKKTLNELYAEGFFDNKD